DFSGLNTGVSKPKSDFTNISRRFQRHDGAGMSKRMRRHTFLAQRWTMLHGSVDVFAENVFKTGARHLLVASVEKKFRYSCLAANRQPSPQSLSGFPA